MTAIQLQLGLDDRGSLGLPRQAEPMRARPAAEAFDSADYLFETRWNGVRALCSVEAGALRLRNRRLGEVSSHFPELDRIRLAVTEQPLLLDGEIVIVDERGRPDPDALQRRLRTADAATTEAEAARRPACYLAWDVLFRGRQWLVAEPLTRRKRILAEAVHPSDCLYPTESFETEGRALFQAAVDSDLEGIVAKPRAGLYAPGGIGSWLIVGRGSEELVVGGCCVRIAGGQRVVEPLLGSFDDEGQLIFTATARPLAEGKLREDLLSAMNSLQIERSPFAGGPPAIACWMRPELVVSVRFAQADGRPVDPVGSVERIRLDVAPDECLLAVDSPGGPAGPPRSAAPPRLTMLSTLPLPLEEQPSRETERPPLRLLDGRR